MQKYVNTILDRRGNAIIGAQVRVTDSLGALVTIYNSNNSADVAPNPITMGELGRFAFYAVNGRYNLEVFVDGVWLTTTYDILLYDPVDLASTLVTLANSWVPYDPTGAGLLIPRATKLGNKTVMLEGGMKAGIITAGTVLGTVPVGYRPVAVVLFPVVLNGGVIGIIRVNPAGEIKAEKAVDGNMTCLDGIIYRAA
jgi:hypothetical protein